MVAVSNASLKLTVLELQILVPPYNTPLSVQYKGRSLLQKNSIRNSGEREEYFSSDFKEYADALNRFNPILAIIYLYIRHVI